MTFRAFDQATRRLARGNGNNILVRLQEVGNGAVRLVICNSRGEPSPGGYLISISARGLARWESVSPHFGIALAYDDNGVELIGDDSEEARDIGATAYVEDGLNTTVEVVDSGEEEDWEEEDESEF